MAATATSKITVEHVFGQGFDTSPNQTGSTGGRAGGTAEATQATTPAVTKTAVTRVTLGGGGTATLDLTAITDLDGKTVTLSGLKPLHVTYTPATANTHTMTVAKGASNGYAPLGSAFARELSFGGGAVSGDCYGGNANAVDATHKNLDFTGTAGEVVTVSVAAG